MAYKIVNDDSLTSVANAIRVKGEISGTLEFPDGFVSAIQNLAPSGGNDFLVTLSWDAQNEIWIPDRTWAEVEAAYNAGKTLLLNDYYDQGNIEYYGNLYVDSDNPLFIIASVAYWDWDNDCLMSDEYFWDDDDGWRLDYRHQIITPNFESITRTYTPTTSTQTETITYNQSDYNGIDHVSVTVNPIPSQYIIPSGILSVSQNGIYDIYSMSSVDVQVSGGGGSDHDAEDAIIARTISGVYENSTATKIGTYAFISCSKLTTVIFTNATSIGTYAFYGCSKLTTASFPNATSIGASAFYSCSSLTTVSFPNATSIGAYAFYSCSNLATASFPKVTSIGNSAFHNCKSLTTASFPNAASISTYCFRNCQSLESLYVLASSVATLGTSVFLSTPMSLSSYLGHFGSIYVPASLVNTYKSATNWSAYAERITSYVE